MTTTGLPIKTLFLQNILPDIQFIYGIFIIKRSVARYLLHHVYNDILVANTLIVFR